eukprot:TRINITY_DN48532_c0_g2_i1.p1 TRINITY_DN48532_c0_g2~~TRINITY_DN48532_c0_g2_i1.p1  ORF type:complete len:1191 (+),score=234.38 TRINITY_DN48532_c0_g2_i1:174-3746(+)
MAATSEAGTASSRGGAAEGCRGASPACSTGGGVSPTPPNCISEEYQLPPAPRMVFRRACQEEQQQRREMLVRLVRRYGPCMASEDGSYDLGRLRNLSSNHSAACVAEASPAPTLQQNDDLLGCVDAGARQGASAGAPPPCDGTDGRGGGSLQSEPSLGSADGSDAQAYPTSPPPPSGDGGRAAGSPSPRHTPSPIPSRYSTPPPSRFVATGTPVQGVELGPLRFKASLEGGNLLSAKLLTTGAVASGQSSQPTNAGSDGDADASPESAPAETPETGAAGWAEELEYELHVDGDTQSWAGHTQWFYFGVLTYEFTGTVRFRIVNMQKKKSLHQHGLQPHVFSMLQKQRGWQPFACEAVSYSLNGKSGPGRADHSSLEWTYRIDCPGDEIYFAAYPPYTYSMLNDFLSELDEHEVAREHFRCYELCRCLSQLPVPLLVISQGIRCTDSQERKRVGKHSPGQSARRGAEEPRAWKRGALVVLARQHPGEVVGSWTVQGLIRFLLGPTPVAKLLREEFVIHIVPMVNVDGVIHGNSRCTLAGLDPNRIWHDPNPIIHPDVFAVKRHLRRLAEGSWNSGVPGYNSKGIEVFLDFHGHSAKFGSFFYGSCPTSRISNALLPKLCATATRDVAWEACHWRCPRSHRKSARYVVFKQLGVKHSFTLECSLFAPAPLPVGGASSGGGWTAAKTFTPERVEWLGMAIGRVFAAFFNLGTAQPLPAPPPCAAAGGLLDEEGEVSPLSPSKQAAVGCTCGRCEDCCSDPLLPDLSCARVLASRPWMQLQRLEATSANEVLKALQATYGDRVPDHRVQSGGDDGGASDGDDGMEGADGPEESDSATGRGEANRAQSAASPTLRRPTMQHAKTDGNLQPRPVRRLIGAKEAQNGRLESTAYAGGQVRERASSDEGSWGDCRDQSPRCLVEEASKSAAAGAQHRSMSIGGAPQRQLAATMGFPSPRRVVRLGRPPPLPPAEVAQQARAAARCVSSLSASRCAALTASPPPAAPAATSPPTRGAAYLSPVVQPLQNGPPGCHARIRSADSAPPVVCGSSALPRRATTTGNVSNQENMIPDWPGALQGQPVAAKLSIPSVRRSSAASEKQKPATSHSCFERRIQQCMEAAAQTWSGNGSGAVAALPGAGGHHMSGASTHGASTFQQLIGVTAGNSPVRRSSARGRSGSCGQRAASGSRHASASPSGR